MKSSNISPTKESSSSISTPYVNLNPPHKSPSNLARTAARTLKKVSKVFLYKYTSIGETDGLSGSFHEGTPIKKIPPTPLWTYKEDRVKKYAAQIVGQPLPPFLWDRARCASVPSMKLTGYQRMVRGEEGTMDIGSQCSGDDDTAYVGAAHMAGGINDEADEKLTGGAPS